MTKGRRAADRRREREAQRGGAGGGGYDDDNDDATSLRLDEATDKTASPRRGAGSRSSAKDETRVAIDEITDRGASPRRHTREGVPSGDGDLSGALTAAADPEVTQPGARLPPGPTGGALYDLADMAAGAIPVLRSPCFLGRGSSCGLQLDDPLASRVHAALSYVEEDQMWILEDTGSRNGTLLNGVLLDRPRVLAHGDVFQVGQGTFRFVWFDGLPEQLPEHTVTEITHHTLTGYRAPTRVGPAPAQREKRAMGVWWAVLVALLLVGAAGGFGAYVVLKGRVDPAQIEGQIDRLVLDAKALLDKRRFDDARARIDTIYALAPGHPKARSLEKTLDSERSAQAALAKAKALIAEGKLDDGRAELRKIADTSLFADDRDEVLKGLAAKDLKRELEAIEALLQSGSVDEALARLEAFLAANPGDLVAGRLQKRGLAIKSYRPPKNASVVRAEEAFGVGNPEQARIIAAEEAKKGGSEAQAYLDKLQRFESLYAKGQAALQQKSGARAEAALDGAYELASSLSGGKSPSMRRKVGRDLADALLLVALTADGRGDECAAARARLRAHDLDPEDSAVKSQKRKLEKEAKAALGRAQAKKGSSPERAKAIAEKALCLASPQSEVGKALRALAQGS